MKLKILLIFALVQYLDASMDVLYPFGTDHGDKNFSDNHPILGPFQITPEFPFFNKSFSSYFINLNGLISFNSTTTNITQIQFPVRDLNCIAPFWNELNSTNGGTIFYRQVTNSTILNLIGLEIKNSYENFVNFRPTWALIVTWFELANESNEKNTFQATIATNGRNSFAIFNYHKLEWSKLDNIKQLAQVGFNLDDGFTFYTLSYFTSNVTSIQYESNVKRPGRWIFRIDDDLEEGGCKTQGYVSINPYIVYFIGGEDVQITGPCFDASNGNATIQIESYDKIDCKIINSNICVFKTPLFNRIGRISLVLTINGNEKFYASLYTRDQSVRPEINGLKPYYYKKTQSNETLSINWNYGYSSHIYVIRILNNTTETKLIKTHTQKQNNASLSQSDLFFDKSFASVENNYLVVGFKKNLSEKIQLENYLFIYNYVVLNNDVIENDNEQTNVTSNSTCGRWAMDQKDISLYMQRLPPCWPRLPWFAPSSFGDFIQDKVCNPSNSDGCSYLHNGSKVCYTSRSSNFFNSKKTGQQCCYDSNSNLVVGPPGGGTLDLAHTDNPIDHFIEDVKPYYWCCILSDQCDLYYEKRPSDNGTRWTPPSPGGGSGDPHFTTFDGVEYTFNGLGEFTLFEISEVNFTCQIRTSPLRLSDGSNSTGTVFKAVAIKGDSKTDLVQIELDSGNNLLIYVNGILSEIDDQFVNLNEILLKKNNDTNIELIYSVGINFQIILTPLKNAFLIFSSIESKFKDKTRGLLGNFNGNKKDDFLLPNGTVLDLNSENDKDIFEQFGQKWLTNAKSSVFTYQQGFQHENFIDLDYEPKFIQNGINFSNSSLEEIAKKKCGSNKNCLYDISVTSEIEIGVLNLNFDEKLEMFQKEIQQISQSTSTSPSTSASNNIVTTTFNSSDRVYTSWKNYTFMFIELILIFQIFKIIYQ